MFNIRYYIGNVVAVIWFWFFLGLIDPGLPSVIRLLIAINMLIYIDLAIRISTKDYKKGGISKNIYLSNSRLFSRRIKIQWLYHIITFLLYLGIAKFYYNVSWSSQNLYLMIFILILGFLLLESVLGFLSKKYNKKE